MRGSPGCRNPTTCPLTGGGARPVFAVLPWFPASRASRSSPSPGSAGSTRSRNVRLSPQPAAGQTAACLLDRLRPAAAAAPRGAPGPGHPLAGQAPAGPQAEGLPRGFCPWSPCVRGRAQTRGGHTPASPGGPVPGEGTSGPGAPQDRRLHRRQRGRPGGKRSLPAPGAACPRGLGWAVRPAPGSGPSLLLRWPHEVRQQQLHRRGCGLALLGRGSCARHLGVLPRVRGPGTHTPP